LSAGSVREGSSRQPFRHSLPPSSTGVAYRGGTSCAPMVFMVIAVTVVVAGATGGLVARLLRLRQESSGWLVLGAHELGRVVARTLQECGERALCIDSNPQACNEAEREDLTVIHGNGLSDRTLERARVDTRVGAIALSPNEEINLLFLQKVRRQARIKQLFGALRDSDYGVTRPMLERIDAQIAFGREEDVELWSLRLRRKRAVRQAFERVAKAGERAAETEGIQPNANYLPLVICRRRSVSPVGDALRPQPEDRLWCLIYTEEAQAARALLAGQGWRPVDPSTLEPIRPVRTTSGIWWHGST
jgi:hypothetical protein